MDLLSESLPALVRELKSRVELEFKRDIQRCVTHFGTHNSLPWMPGSPAVKNGDDAAAILQADGSFLLFATDGMRPEFVRKDPWFAGYSSVMVNISDIAAMGGRPLAIVDVLYLGNEHCDRLLDGMRAASLAFGVPIVGGHTSRTTGSTTVSCAIVGTAHKLLESDAASPGDELLYAVDLRGVFRSPLAFNAATTTSDAQLRLQMSLLADCAEAELCCAAKDVSNAGLLGTVLMLLQSSGVGADVDLASIPSPLGVDASRWLRAFPSFGFVLCTKPQHVRELRSRFQACGLSCERIGTITASPQFSVHYGAETQTFADIREPLTGFGRALHALAG